MRLSIVLPIIFGFFGGIIIQKMNILFAHRFRFLDYPSNRRRHSKSTPVTGGLGILATYGLVLTMNWALDSSWIYLHSFSLGMTFLCMGLLTGIGLVDDLRGVSPAWKLISEFLIAGIFVYYEPRARGLCEYWSDTFGFMVWPLAMTWIVGVTNALNLIDGMDGLAGGMSFLVAVSVSILGFLASSADPLDSTMILFLLPALLAFLRHNWFPAKIFLGDNGSLPLGFLLATTSMTCRPPTQSWVMIGSAVLMLGYPILDMGLAVYKRYRKKQPLFKADRNHLHYRIVRLGLTVPQTVALLLGIGVYLQVSALCINLISTPAAVFGIATVCFSIFTLLYLVRSIEKWRVRRLYLTLVRDKKGKSSSVSAPDAELRTILSIELETLLEAALLEEKGRYRALVAALELLLGSIIRTSDLIFAQDQKISIILGGPLEEGDVRKIELRFREKIDQFLQLYELQCSLASIPIAFEKGYWVKSTHGFTLVQSKEDRAA